MKNKYFKRVMAVVLAAGMVISLAACGKKETVELNDGTLQ